MTSNEQRLYSEMSTFLSNGMYLAYSDSCMEQYHETNNTDYLIMSIYTNLSGRPSLHESSEPFLRLRDLDELCTAFNSINVNMWHKLLEKGLSRCFTYSHFYTKADVQDILIDYIVAKKLPDEVIIIE